MTNTPINLQDLRRNIYVKAKAEPSWRFWGLYVHVCKMETLHEAYTLARKNNGAPGVDGVTFAVIEAQGVEQFLEQIQGELVKRTYVPLRARRKEIPKDGGKVRVLSIPAIRDRVVQGALKLIMEPIFEADFEPGSYGYQGQTEAIHEAAAQAQDMTNRRVMKSKGQVDEEEKRKNRTKSRVRARVEWPFRILKRVFHYTKVRYRGIKKNHEWLLTAFALVNLYQHRKRLAPLGA